MRQRERVRSVVGLAVIALARLHGAYLLAMLANMFGSVMLHDPKRQDEVAAVFNRVFERAGVPYRLRVID